MNSAIKLERSVALLREAERDFTPRRRYLLKHTTRTVPARLTHIESRLDIKTLSHQPGGDALAMNDIARVGISLGQPIVCDLFDELAQTGSFILIDAVSNQTAGAGMIRAVDA